MAPVSMQCILNQSKGLKKVYPSSEELVNFDSFMNFDSLSPGKAIFVLFVEFFYITLGYMTHLVTDAYNPKYCPLYERTTICPNITSEMGLRIFSYRGLVFYKIIFRCQGS